MSGMKMSAVSICLETSYGYDEQAGNYRQEDHEDVRLNVTALNSAEQSATRFELLSQRRGLHHRPHLCRIRLSTRQLWMRRGQWR